MIDIKLAYNQSINLNPSDPVIYYNIGICNKELNKIDNASKSFKQAIGINSKYYDAYYELGLIYFQTDNFTESKKVFNILVNEVPNYSKREQIGKQGQSTKIIEQ